MPQARKQTSHKGGHAVARRVRQFRVDRSVFKTHVYNYFSSLDSAVSLSCWILFSSGEHKQLVEKEINPLDYNDKWKFRDDFAAVSFLRKCDSLNTGINTKEEALKKFRASEDSCRITNRKFKDLRYCPEFTGSNVWLLNAVTRKIGVILEPIGLSWYKELLDAGAFGPGSSTLVTGVDTSAERKFREELHITTSLSTVFWKRRKRLYPSWFTKANAAEFPQIQEASRVTTVPKNAKTDRTIAIEPGLNIWFQKALGTMIRRRLRRAGYNLDSDLKNQRQAYLGSIHGNVATVDMRAASDTISKRVVEEILPLDWYRALDTCRSLEYNLDGTTGVFEKFSSMGNGFTFELESLIFLTAALACCEYCGVDDECVSIFGDDVTLPSECYSLFVSFTNFLGFTVNDEKSFTSSNPFRESCGCYYFDGLDVKPHFQKKGLSNADSVFAYANAIRHLSHRRVNKLGCDKKFELAYAAACDLLPSSLRLRGDVVGGNGCLHSNFDEAKPKKLRYWLEGYTFKCFTWASRSLHSEHESVLTARVWRRSLIAYGNSCMLRRDTRVRLNTLIANQWYNFGPWL